MNSKKCKARKKTNTIRSKGKKNDKSSDDDNPECRCCPLLFYESRGDSVQCQNCPIVSY